MYAQMTPEQISISVNNMKREIIESGPIIVGILVSTSLQTPDPTNGGTTVYSGCHSGDTILGAHAVTVLGWGTSLKGRPTDPYWIVQNSWGTSWGDKGFYYHRLGTNSCSIESAPHAADAEAPRQAPERAPPTTKAIKTVNNTRASDATHSS
jgi:hypothetical protein